MFWSCDAHRRLIGKVPDVGKDQGQKQKGTAEDEMVGWHELAQTLGDGEGQGRPGVPQSMGSQSWTRLGN